MNTLSKHKNSEITVVAKSHELDNRNYTQNIFSLPASIHEDITRGDNILKHFQSSEIVSMNITNKILFTY